jgi:hypothetical protein
MLSLSSGWRSFYDKDGGRTFFESSITSIRLYGVTYKKSVIFSHRHENLGYQKACYLCLLWRQSPSFLHSQSDINIQYWREYENVGLEKLVPCKWRQLATEKLYLAHSPNCRISMTCALVISERTITILFHKAYSNTTAAWFHVRIVGPSLLVFRIFSLIYRYVSP